MSRCRLRALLVLLLVVVGGCLLLGLAVFVNDRFAPASSEAALREALQDKLAEAHAVHAALDNLWSRLERGQAALCEAEAVAHPYFLAWRSRDRAAYPVLAALADALNASLRDLHRAADVWVAACRSTDAAIAAEDAVAARAALERARAGLAQIATSLTP